MVGLGASGLAAVEALADRGLCVVGVDAGRVAAGASGRNGGFLLGGAAAYLHSAIALWGVDAAIGLYRETLAELDRLARQLGPGVVGRNGSIRLAGLPGEPVANAQAADCGAVDRGPADREAELADCAAHAAALHRGGIAVERYAGPLGEGLFLPDDAATNPARRALAVAGPLAGRANLHEHTPVVRIESGRVITAAGTVSAGVVVVAVDGRLELLLPQLAGRVRTARLQMLATAPVATDRLPCPVYGRWGYDYAQQDAAGRLFVGGGRDRFVDAEWTADASPTDEVQHHIERVAAPGRRAGDRHAPLGRVRRLHPGRTAARHRGR